MTKEEKIAYMEAWRAKNSERLKAYQKKNRAKLRQYYKKWYNGRKGTPEYEAWRQRNKPIKK